MIQLLMYKFRALLEKKERNTMNSIPNMTPKYPQKTVSNLFWREPRLTRWPGTGNLSQKSVDSIEKKFWRTTWQKIWWSWWPWRLSEEILNKQSMRSLDASRRTVNFSSSWLTLLQKTFWLKPVKVIRIRRRVNLW